MAQDNVLVPLLSGFEEIEAVTIIDVLRRADIPVIVAGERPGPVEGSHGIAIVATTALDDVDPDQLAMVALPGGLPGAQHLADSERVRALLRAVRERGGYTAAICAAPMALAAAGVHSGHKVTSYPGFDRYLEGAQYCEDAVVVDDRVITSRGPGTALAFALALVAALKGDDVARALGERMLVARG
ncbi:MAG: DJ-1/PfpI family protein [Deltaproteobacteria bacterium]|nr:MAG: DJ-1/PfpI family protein [Deltaproteobacteria bacterium]